MAGEDSDHEADSPDQDRTDPTGPASEEPTQAVRNPMFPGADSEPANATVQWSTGAPPSTPDDRPWGVSPPMSVQRYREDRDNMDDSKRGLYLLLAVVGTAIIIGGVSWYYGFARYEGAPRLVGMSETTALGEADAAGFDFKVAKRVFSEKAPLGTVVSTDPEPGKRVLPGALIQGTVSKGPERHPVPDLQGLSTSEAIKALEKERLQVGKVTRGWHDTITKGHVTGLSGVKVGDRLRRNAKVSFVVSKGREPLEVVSTIGQSRGSATGTLQSIGFRVAVRQVYSDSAAAGVVVGQDPSSGTYYRGDTITITVSLGPEEVDVPNVVGQSCDSGDDTLSKWFDISRNGDGPVITAQSPNGGKAKIGSTVNIVCPEFPGQRDRD